MKLQLAEARSAVDGEVAHEHPARDQHHHQREDQADRGDRKIANRLEHARPDDPAATRLGDARAEQAADQRMAGRGGDAEPQVIRFQLIAPISAPKITWASTMSAWIVPLPIV
jgi:hypothetical protein